MFSQINVQRMQARPATIILPRCKICWNPPWTRRNTTRRPLPTPPSFLTAPSPLHHVFPTISSSASLPPSLFPSQPPATLVCRICCLVGHRSFHKKMFPAPTQHLFPFICLAPGFKRPRPGPRLPRPLPYHLDFPGLPLFTHYIFPFHLDYPAGFGRDRFGRCERW